jgi:hypothetical protein
MIAHVSARQINPPRLPFLPVVFYHGTLQLLPKVSISLPSHQNHETNLSTSSPRQPSGQTIGQFDTQTSGATGTLGTTQDYPALLDYQASSLATTQL